MNKYITTALTMLMAVSFAMAQNIETANKSFTDRLFNQAIEEYAPLLTSKNSEIRYPAQLKTTLAYFYSFKYDKALQAIFAYPAPKDKLWKARYLIIKAKALTIYSNYSNAPLVETETDPTKFTYEQNQTALKETYSELWKMRKDLANMPLKDSLEYVDNHYGSISALVLTPTLFDFTKGYWINNDIQPRKTVLEESYKIGGKNREAVAEVDHILLLEYSLNNQADIKTSTKAQILAYVAGNGQKPNIKNDYIFEAKEPLAKAYGASEAANYYKADKQYETAVNTLNYCLTLPLNYNSDTCKSSLDQITRPVLRLQKNPPFNTAVGKNAKISLTLANLDKFYMHIYELKMDDLATKTINENTKVKTPVKRWRQDISWQKKLELLKTTPLRTLTLEPEYDAKYTPLNTEVEVPYMADGIYFIALSKDNKPTENEANFLLNFTDLGAFATAFSTTKNLSTLKDNASYFNIYTLDPQNGNLKPNIAFFTEGKKYKTNKEGQRWISANKDGDSISILAQDYGNHAIISSINYQKSERQKYLITLNTDRAIYRPGDTVSLQANIIEFKAPNYAVYTGKEKLQLTLQNASYKTIETKELTLDAMGSASANFKIPQDSMLGNFSIVAKFAKTSSSKNFSVEEFKQPEFEINLNKQDGIAAYNKPLTIEGKAKYYYGNPVAEAKVSYSISKEYYIPWFVRAWWPPITQSRQKRIEGVATTAKDGSFNITFTPEDEIDEAGNAPTLKGRPSNYQVEVFITDDGGRTLKANQTYQVSGQEYFFEISNSNNFLRENTPAAMTAKMVNAASQPLTGSATAQIIKIELPQNGLQYYTDWEKIKELETVASYSIDFKKDETAQISVPALKESYYMLKLIAKDSSGQDNIGKEVFAFINMQKPALNLLKNTLAEKDTYYPGETATILIGSPKTLGNKYVEVYKESFLAEQKTIKTPGIAVLEIPIKTEYQGGININWFSVYDYNAYQDSIEIPVPYSQKDLTITTNAPEAMAPQEAANFKIEAKDSSGKAVNGQAVITVFDGALNYYKEHSLSLQNPYSSNNYGYNPLKNSFGNINHLYFNVMDDGVFYDSYSYSANSVAESAPQDTRAVRYAVMSKSAALGSTAAAQAAPAVAIRQNFAQTAFWAPSLPIKDGIGLINFTLPETLTKWIMSLTVFTADAKTGLSEVSFISKKDLMIALQTPRFLREGDKMELRAIITNNTKTSLPVNVELTPKLNDSDATALLKLKEPTKQITVPAGEQAFVVWPIETPATSGIFSFTATARSGSLSDGELKTFPLLPSKQKLAQSALIAVKDGANTLSLDKLAKDKNITLEAVHLQIDPSVIMPVLEATALLRFSSYDTATSLANTYLPLAIINKMYETYPELKSSVDAMPKRTTTTKPWDKEDEMLLGELAASPWYSLSKGYQDEAKTIDIFDPALVAKVQKETFLKLKDYQNSDGGFTWIKGGKSSSFVTLLILDYMGQAFSHGVEIPKDTVKPALAYLTSTITVDVVTPSFDNLTTALYMAYVLTSFPKDWYNYEVKKLVDTAASYSNYMTPLGKAHAAIVYNRLGEGENAKLYLNQLFDGATEDDTLGIYWQPGGPSWLWYNDSLTTHAAALQALSAVNPQDSRLSGLVKWLMLNKKTNLWGGSEAAAKAVYALLGVMDKTGALKETKLFNINWASEDIQLEVKPFDLLSKPLTFSKYNAAMDSLSATINKSVAAADNNITATATPQISLDDFASLTALFTTTKPVEPQKGFFNISKKFYLVKDKKVKALKDGDKINVGDEIEVRLTVDTKNPFNFVLISDPTPAAFEADNTLSGWRWDKLSRYEELKDNKTNFFINTLPNGTYELKYTLRPTTAGVYNVGATFMQSMFAPEFATHSGGLTLQVQ
ncbi:MAG: hypothetical protein LBM71_05570 [Elusimicrobiota bacterium]|jgi:uncharacterized protein YfaS (alpha-2-macroglobulin family)|nr:hypothetical protein [Elusimicrobiota bacterium]